MTRPNHLDARIEALDWLRAVAIIAVMIGHAANQLMPGGAVGVSVFFVLSGYLIAGILLREGMMTPLNIGKFILRRIARIYPMYALHIVAITLFLYLANPEKFHSFTQYIVGFLTFQAGGTGEWFGYGVGVLWTLYVEFWFYVSFPIILWLIFAIPIARAKPLPKLLISFFLISTYCIWQKFMGEVDTRIIYYDHFLLGATAAALVRYDAIPRLFRQTEMMLAGFLMILIAVGIPYPGDRNLLWHEQSLFTAIGTAIVIVTAVAKPPRIRGPLISYIGRISYSMYLVHALVLDINNVVPPIQIVRLRSIIPIVISISSLTYFFVERPIIDWVHRRVRLKLPQKIGAIFLPK